MSSHPQRLRLCRAVDGVRKQQLFVYCDGFRAHLLAGEVPGDMGDRPLGEPGSLGARGPVTVMLEQVIREARTEVIYACAPLPVLRDVSALAARYAIPVQASVDVPMACGIGVSHKLGSL